MSFINYQHFIDKAVRGTPPALKFGIQCDLQPGDTLGELQLNEPFMDHPMSATLGVCVLRHTDPSQVTILLVILCDSMNLKPVITPMVMPRQFKPKGMTHGEQFTRLVVAAWNEVVALDDIDMIERQYLLGYLAHSFIVWPENTHADKPAPLVLSEKGREFAELVNGCFDEPA